MSGLEPLESRTLMAGLQRVEFFQDGIPDSRCAAVPYGQKTIPVPADLSLPVMVSIKGWVDDELLINGNIVQVGQFPYRSSCNGAHNVDYSFQMSSRTFELACGDNFGGQARYSLDIDFTTVVAPPSPPSQPGQRPSPLLDPGNTGLPCSGGCPLNDDRTSHNVNLPSGLLTHRDGTTLASTAAGIGSDAAFEWTSSTAAVGNQMFGNGWIAPGMPQLKQLTSDAFGPTWIAVPFSGSDVRVFARGAGESTAYTPDFGVGSRDSVTKIGSQLVFRTSSGDTLACGDFSSSTAPGARGQFLEQSDASGNRLVATRNADGSLARLDSFVAGSSTATESQIFSLLPAGSANAGKVSSVVVKRAVSDTVSVRTTRYDYYAAGSSFGSPGDLRSISVLDDAGNVIESKQYRYTSATVAGKTVSWLQAVFDGDGSRRLKQAGVSFDSGTNAAVKPFARDWYAFDDEGRVTQHQMQGAGCSACTAGIGTFTYSYATNPSGAAGGFNAWRTKTTETRPDGTQSITYANSRGQPMLNVLVTSVAGVTAQYGTYTRYDDRGLKIWEASPEAVDLPSALADIERYPDLLNRSPSSGNFQYIRDSSGLIEVTTYATTTTATATAAGDVNALVSSTAVMRGDTGTPITREAFTYFVQSAGGRTVTPLATRTTYPNTTTAGGQTTTYAYSFVPGTTQIASQRTTLPTVTTAQNGPGTAAVIDQVFDEVGREIWSRDGDNFLRYTAYDPQTGAIVKSIVDVDTSRTGDFQSLPTGWSTPAGGGLHLVSTFDVDRLGRVVRATDPRGSVKCTVYDDANQSTRTYVGWNAVNGTTTGPIQVTRRDLSGTYTETLTYAATPTMDAQRRPTGGEPIATLQSLTRSITNDAGQVIFVDRYTNLEGIVYSTATATLGTEGANYLRTRYGYNNQGQVERIQNPAGTITISTYDGMARLTGTWVGTNDSTTDNRKWSLANSGSLANMLQVAAYEYDNGNMGNSLLTRVTQFPGGSSPARVTLNGYDWRGRLVITKTGATATPSTEDLAVNRPLTYTEYDNLDRVTGKRVYEGDRAVIVDNDADGVPDVPSADLLRSSQVLAYDALDRAFRTQQVPVDQTTGTVGTARLTSDVFYDRRGNVVATYSPNGPVTQSRYDGAGRLAASYTLGNVPAATWANATSLASSLVLEQNDSTYDTAGNVILTATRQRFHDASTTTYGGLGTPTTGIAARVSYAASYYDAADRLTASLNVGTNGGVAYVRPTAVPARSDTALVTTYAYDAAGRVHDVTDPRGIVARTRSDALGRTTATIANFTGGLPGAQADVTTLFTFDAAGRLASRTAVQPTGTPSQVTGYVYGISPATGSTIASNDVLAETRYPDPVTGLASASERDVSTSNALGERTKFTDRAGTAHTYTYDVTGRQTADAITALGTAVNSAVLRIESAYDVLGRVTSVTSFNLTVAGSATNQVTRAYNGFGQMTTEWQSHTGLVNTATTPRVQYAYSQGTGGNHSRLTGITYPAGSTVNSTYTGVDSAVSRPTSLTGSAAGTGAAITLEAFKYLGAATVVERSRPEVNVTLSMLNLSGTAGAAGDKYTGLDRFGRVVDQRWTQGTAATSPVVDRYSYTYDRNSNRLTRANGLNSSFNETYGYDGGNQLTSFDRGGAQFVPPVSQSWSFDALGNWTSRTTNGYYGNWSANAQNEITGIASLAYSRTGNLTTDADGRKLVYDAWNRLVFVYNASGTEVARYLYDGLNRRIVELVGTSAAPAAANAPVRDSYYSQDWQVLEERRRTASGAIPATAETRFVWSPVYVDAMIARDFNADGNATTGTGGLEQRVYALQDANWNTTAIVAATGVTGITAGSVINRFLYTPYGNSTALTASWGNVRSGGLATTAPFPWAHLFQGLEFTAITELAYVRHRDYSATLGRFIQLDPIGFDAGDNNWYRFVGNGPTGRTDPSGLTFGTDRYDTSCNPQQRGEPQKPFFSWTTSDEEAAWRAEWAYQTEGDRTTQGVQHDFEHGFSATLTKARSGTYYLAFRGTDSWVDVQADTNQGLGFTTSQYDQAIKLTTAVQRRLPPGTRLILTGHSLGGGLATAAAYATGADAITFNASSVNAHYQAQGLAKPGNIRSHVVIGDPLSVGRTCALQWPVEPFLRHRRLQGTVIKHEPRDPDTHSMINFPHHR